MLADVHADLPIARDSVRVWLRGEEMLAAFPLPGRDLWRLMAPAPQDTTDESDEPGVDAELDLLVSRLHQRTGWPASVVRGAEWTSTFRIHRRLAERFRQGRMLLAGDAAHIHSPFGGQGMNTGVGDAENLAWKLALVTRQRAEPSLLDSYETERRPLATEVVASTSALTGLVLGQSPLARVLRDRVFVPSLNVRVVQRLIWEEASQLKVSYRHGPLARRSRRPQLPGFGLLAGPRPGDRVADLPCRHPDGGTTRLHAQLGSTWVLLTPPPAARKRELATRACIDLVRDLLGSDLVTVLTADVPAQHLMLVRPDAHLGWSGHPTPPALHAWLTGVLHHGQVYRTPQGNGPADGGDPDGRTTALMSSPAHREALGLRERKKAQTRARIQETALRLFLTNGYGATTVEQIAADAGVSHMTFFRHFPTKEAVVENDDYDPLIAALIRARPPEEDPITALHRALAGGLAEVYAAHRDVLLVRTRLILTTPALRAHMADSQYATERLFTEALAARGDNKTTFELRVYAAAALAAVTVALSTWVHSDGAEDLPKLVDRAFHVLRPADP